MNTWKYIGGGREWTFYQENMVDIISETVTRACRLACICDLDGSLYTVETHYIVVTSPYVLSCVSTDIYIYTFRDILTELKPKTSLYTCRLRLLYAVSLWYWGTRTCWGVVAGYRVSVFSTRHSSLLVYIYLHFCSFFFFLLLFIFHASSLYFHETFLE